MRRIAIINQKGGVGKTTTTAHLGAALALAGRRVLLIDLDPQAHLTLHFGTQLAEDQPSVYDVLTNGVAVRDVALPVRENLWIVPADIDLAGAEAELISITGREVLLREALDADAAPYDALLIDCPPSLGVLTVNALSACDEVIIPLQAHFFALQGLSRLLDTVTLVRQRINPGLVVRGIVLCMHEGSTRLASEVVDDLSGFLSAQRGMRAPWSEAVVYATRVRRSIKLAECCSFGQTVFEYAPRSHGATDYAGLAGEVFALDPAVCGSDAGPAGPAGDKEPAVDEPRAAAVPPAAEPAAVEVGPAGAGAPGHTAAEALPAVAPPVAAASGVVAATA
ncbi:MAG: ParA family protein [Planctomycetes bacterium]|nr:ParA family protein [Planctomycetota bacterium]